MTKYSGAGGGTSSGRRNSGRGILTGGILNGPALTNSSIAGIRERERRLGVPFAPERALGVDALSLSRLAQPQLSLSADKQESEREKSDGDGGGGFFGRSKSVGASFSETSGAKAGTQSGERDRDKVWDKETTQASSARARTGLLDVAGDPVSTALLKDHEVSPSPWAEGGGAGGGGGLGGSGTRPPRLGSSGLGPHLFAVHSQSKLLFSCKHWDNSFKVTDLETGRLIQVRRSNCTPPPSHYQASCHHLAASPPRATSPPTLTSPSLPSNLPPPRRISRSHLPYTHAHARTHTNSPSTHMPARALSQSVSLHHDVITCLSLATEGDRCWLVTASCDCTIMVWEIKPLSPDQPVDKVICSCSSFGALTPT